MMTITSYISAAMSGSLFTFTLLFIGTNEPWWVALAGVGFLLSLWLVRIQPTNVNDGVIVRVDASDVSQFVDGRVVEWCGVKELHNIHAWSDRSAYTLDDMAVCLGHECHCPDTHMKKAVTK